jgi:hypothetical protein
MEMIAAFSYLRDSTWVTLAKSKREQAQWPHREEPIESALFAKKGFEQLITTQVINIQQLWGVHENLLTWSFRQKVTAIQA